MDPRVTTSQKDLAEQFKLSKQLYDEWLTLAALAESARPLRGQITELRAKVPEELKKRFEEFNEQFNVFGGGGGGPQGHPQLVRHRARPWPQSPGGYEHCSRNSRTLI
jgi:hypothetical protein